MGDHWIDADRCRSLRGVQPGDGGKPLTRKEDVQDALRRYAEEVDRRHRVAKAISLATEWTGSLLPYHEEWKAIYDFSPAVHHPAQGDIVMTNTLGIYLVQKIALIGHSRYAGKVRTLPL